jgi:glucose/arabinose dehydrogenase
MRQTRKSPPRRATRLVLECLEDRTTPSSLPPGFTETAVATGLSNPTAMEFAPNGDLWVLEQGGGLKRFRPGSTTADVVANIANLGLDSQGERGLLGIAFDPNYSSDKWIYLYYTSTSGGSHNRISRFTVDDSNPAHYALVDTTPNPAVYDEVQILNLDPLSSATNHNGGAIHFGPDGKLYVAVGENANGANSQSLSNRLGKILRINPDGSIPSDNPTSFPGISGTTAGANRAIWAVGLRNPYTFTFQPGTGQMFINDVGQNTWEEIDVGGAGRNYGWPTTEGDFSPSQFPNFTRPMYTYSHGTGTFQGDAITGGAFYNPATNQFPADYAGDYFFGDYVNNWIHVVNSDGSGVRQFATGAPGVVDLRVTGDGSLYYLARNAGTVYRVNYSANQAPVIT